MIPALILIPFIAGFFAFFIYSNAIRRSLLVLCGITELALAIYCWVTPPKPLWGVLALDPFGQLILTVTCLLFLAASWYAVGYLRREGDEVRLQHRSRLHFTNQPEAVFTACLLFFLGAAVLVALSQHMGLLWVAVEATTLATAPLIYFHRHQRSLEATWKYLIICSVGIALALLGNFLLDVAWQTDPDNPIPMTLYDMIHNASGVNGEWFKAAFIFIFIGYGTKMGLAPMHTWLPDAHSEAPSLVSALLSGALLNCAFLGILRLHQLSIAAGYQDFSQQILVVFGLFSMVIAALFIVGQNDFKRMLAYSSVEHMGVLALGVGVGGFAAFGSMLHLVCHSVTKAAMFMLAGNILANCHTQVISNISGLFTLMPRTAPLWLAGFMALVGSPPFGIFASEFTILRGMLADGFGVVPFIYLACLGVIFVGMASACLRMVYGTPKEGLQPDKEEWSLIIPSLILLAASLTLGVYQPHWLRNLLLAAAECATGIAPL